MPIDQHQRLLALDGESVTVDLEECTITLPDQLGVYTFEVDGFARHCLLRGMDRLDFLLANEAAIKEHEEHP